jgi:hypothetical protein
MPYSDRALTGNNLTEKRGECKRERTTKAAPAARREVLEVGGLRGEG